NAGANVIQLTPIEGDAPIMDKIVITNKETGEENMRIMESAEVQFTAPTFQQSLEFIVFPNPVRSGESVTIQVPGAFDEGVPTQVSMTDMSGRTIIVDTVANTENQAITIQKTLRKGIYVIMIQHGNQWFTKKLKVQ
ncbi:T9SS type A sorting domain-containing protein, partial [Aquiflexum sp.]|uniref:T9SS type A sorting domain-containing protein n=1 Tax=Aquiflexum sp. TaxID=1872584 RepID=UPI003593E30C